MQLETLQSFILHLLPSPVCQVSDGLRLLCRTCRRVTASWRLVLTAFLQIVWKRRSAARRLSSASSRSTMTAGGGAELWTPEESRSRVQLKLRKTLQNKLLSATEQMQNSFITLAVVLYKSDLRIEISFGKIQLNLHHSCCSTCAIPKKFLNRLLS